MISAVSQNRLRAISLVLGSCLLAVLATSTYSNKGVVVVDGCVFVTGNRGEIRKAVRMRRVQPSGGLPRAFRFFRIFAIIEA